MKELWEEARQYGLVKLFTMDTGKYHCWVEFTTVKGIKLEAKSTFKCDTPEEALKDAIAKCKEIVNSFKSIGDNNGTSGKLNSIEDNQVSAGTGLVCNKDKCSN